MATLVQHPPPGAIPAGEGALDIRASSEDEARLYITNPLGKGYVNAQINGAVARACSNNPALAATVEREARVYFTLGQGAEMPDHWRFNFWVYLLHR
jgi:hypothetical protein